MTPNSFATIDSALGVLPDEQIQQQSLVTVGSSEIVVFDQTPEADKKDDYEFVREKLRDTIETAVEGFEEIMELAKDAESPRAFEVAANFANTIASVSKNLMELHKETAVRAKVQDQQTPSSVTNNIFTGTTAELLKLLKGQQIDQNGS